MPRRKLCERCEQLPAAINDDLCVSCLSAIDGPIIKGPAKCAGSKLNQTSDVVEIDKSGRELSPGEEATRAALVAFRHALGWSQLQAAIELDISLSTYKRWEAVKDHTSIRALEFETMRRLAHEHGLDSKGKLKVG